MCVCQEIKCPDFSLDDGEPAWCYWAGCPANVAIAKCPKVAGNQKDKEQSNARDTV